MKKEQHHSITLCITFFGGSSLRSLPPQNVNIMENVSSLLQKKMEPKQSIVNFSNLTFYDCQSAILVIY